ncbi:MAG: archease [Candidatus Micrarchaeota archaeon]
MPYKFLEHTSDIIIEAQNRDFSSALADVAAGMFSQMGAEDSSGKDSIEVSVSAQTKEGLVVVFLTEIIAQCEIRGFTPKSVEVTDSKEGSIKATVRGERKASENIIKAVTYHELEVSEKEGSCKIRVLLDI